MAMSYIALKLSTAISLAHLFSISFLGAFNSHLHILECTFDLILALIVFVQSCELERVSHFA